MEARSFWETVKKHSRFFSGVPCSYLTAVIDYASNDEEITYIPAVREDVALGIASSCYFTGRLGGVLMQNSGIGNIVNPLTSFNFVYKIPVLLVISWRGQDGKDAPEHMIMGPNTPNFLQLLDIPFKVLSEDNLEDSISYLLGEIERRKTPAALIIPKGVVK